MHIWSRGGVVLQVVEMVSCNCGARRGIGGSIVKNVRKGISLASAAMLVLAAPALGGGSSLAMLDQLESGRWELREHASSVPQKICVASGRRLIQLRHPGAQCSNFVVEDGPAQVVVQYTCTGHGYGRTRVRRETNRLVQIDTQGIVDGLPFEFSVEARRVGECDAG